MRRINLRKHAACQNCVKRSLYTQTRPRGKRKELMEEVQETLNPRTYFTENMVLSNHRRLFEIGSYVIDWIMGEANYLKPFVVPKGHTTRWKKTCLLVLPNLRKMNIESLGSWNMLKELFDISWKKRKTSLWGWRNRKHNKYLGAMYSRLTHLREERDVIGQSLAPSGNLMEIPRRNKVNKRYWNLALFLIQRSMVFRMVHINKVLNKETTWPGKESLHSVIQLAQRVQRRIAENTWMEVEVRRKWIDGDKRPLGVPKLEDRVIGSMFANLLEYYLWDSFKFNHGYQCGKGSGTAWEKILSHLIHYAYIWEFDLSGCFNKISHEALGRILRAIGLPSWLWMSLLKMQKRVPAANEESGGEMWEEDTGMGSIQIQSGKSKEFMYINNTNKEGVAQGHNLSPLLSIIVIEHAIRSWMKSKYWKGETMIGYADDGLFFSMEKFNWQYFGSFVRPWGMLLAYNKCGSIREAYKWIKPIKFLGLIYDPFHEKFKAATRKGSRVILESCRDVIMGNGGIVIVKDGAFIREGYTKLGDKIPFHNLKWKEGMVELIVTMLIGTINYPLYVMALLYWTNRGWLSWYWALMLTNAEPSGWILMLILGCMFIDGVGVPDISIYQDEETGYKQMITWRLVLKAKKLNAFIARLYNKQLADKIVPQDFSLKMNRRSLMWYIHRTNIDNNQDFESFLKGQGLKNWNWIDGVSVEDAQGPLLSTVIEEDLGGEINSFNATTIGTHLMIEYLSRKGNHQSPTKGGGYRIYRKMLDQLHINGYWMRPTTAMGPERFEDLQSYFGRMMDIGSTSMDRRMFIESVTVEMGVENIINQNAKGRNPLHEEGYETYPDWAMPAQRIQRWAPFRLVKESDWVYHFTKGWDAVVKQDRYRWFLTWRAKAELLMSGRIYRQYRLNYLSRPGPEYKEVLGWLPVIPKKKRTIRLGEPQSTSNRNKFPLRIREGGHMLYCERKSHKPMKIVWEDQDAQKPFF